MNRSSEICQSFKSDLLTNYSTQSKINEDSFIKEGTKVNILYFNIVVDYIHGV